MCKLLYLLFYNGKLYTKVEWEYIYISTDGNKKSNTNTIINAMLYILIW